MIGATRVTRRRPFGVLRTVAIAAGAFILACGKDSLVTAPKPSPGGARLDGLGDPSGGATVVISQVYGGGGNTGASYKNDFIEIHNRGTSPVSIDGWSVQYASSSGSFTQLTSLTGTLEPGQYLLVQEGAGVGGSTDLPTPHLGGTINMSATTGKVALVQGTLAAPSTALNCGLATAPCAAGSAVDLIGYGAVNYFEGTSTAPLTNTTAALRKGAGCTDSDVNSADFDLVAPSPRTTGSPFVTCGESAPQVLSTAPATGGVLGDPAAITISFSEPVDVIDSWFRVSCSVSGLHSAEVAGGPQTYTLTGLGTFSPAETCNGTVVAAQVHDKDVEDPPDLMDADFSWSFTAPGDLPSVRFTEIHYDNVNEDSGEAIEIEGPAGTNLTGWKIVLYNGSGGAAYNTAALSGVIPATCGTRGVIVQNYPVNGIQNGSPDGFALVNGSTVVEFLSYEGVFAAVGGPAGGMTSVDIGKSETSVPLGQSLQRNPDGSWHRAAPSTFGECNLQQSEDVESISFSGRLATDPALPVGFEDQLFATLHGGAITPDTVFTWTSATPDIATIDARGVMHALSAGTATFVATAPDGTTGSYTLPTTVATLGGTADYRGNTEFGIPTDGDASDDFIVTRDQYTISYNQNRNTPNWVSYEFDVTHFQPADASANIDRCDCFTHDPALPASFTHLSTADYTGAGAFAGYGIDRGHMARSFDFTSGSLDNARSYYLSNIIPQAAAVNQGPWKILEDSLGNLARFHDKEVYVIDGVAGSKGSVKGEGKITIPASEWKVAVVLPRDHGLADIHNYRDIDDVIAVMMPNEPTINADWKIYKTTVDEIERASGYDVLALLPDRLERSVQTSAFAAAKTLDGAANLISALTANAGNAQSLQSKVAAAQMQLGMDNVIPARNQLRSVLNELDAMVQSGRATAADATALRTMIEGVISSI